MQKKLEWFAKLLIVATFFVPLVVVASSFIFPFVVPKVVVFRSIVLLMLGSYLILLASNWRAYAVRLTPITIAVGFFFLSFLLSTFIGVDWYHSFWDNHERMLGLFTVTHYILYYLMVTTLVLNWVEWKWFLRLFLFAGTIVMLLGVWQKFVDPAFLLNQGGGRVSATLGNAIYYSAYGLFLMTIGVLLALKERNKGLWFWASILGAGLGFLGIFLGGTKGTLLGLVVGIGAVCLSYFIGMKDHPTMRKVFLGILVSGVVFIGLLFGFRHTEFVRSIPTVGNLLNIQLSGGTANTRIMAWGIAVDAWEARPVFGWGPNNFFFAFNQYYRPEFLSHGYGETWFDNAHNIIMNTLAVQGTFGILVYVALFAVAITVLFKKRKKESMDIHVVSIGVGFLVAHFVSNMFVFENPTSYLYFFFFLALINQQSTKKEGENRTEADASISVGLSAVVAVFVLLMIYLTNIQPARANMATYLAIQSIYTEHVDPMTAYKAATAIPSPHIDDIRSDFARNVMAIIPQYAAAGQTEVAIKLSEFLYTELQKNRIIHPRDIRTHMYQAQISQTEASFNQIPELLFRAEKDLEVAVTYSPKRQQLLYMLSTIKLQLLKNDEAIALLEKSIVDYPAIPEGWWRLAIVYKEVGNVAKAKQIINDAEEAGIIFTDKGAEVAEQIRAL